MKGKKINGIMLACSLAAGLVGWFAAEALLAVLWQRGEWPGVLAVGVYLGAAGLFGVAGAVLSEVWAKRYQNSKNRRIFRRCACLACVVGAAGMAAAGCLVQFLYEQELRAGARNPDVVFLMDRSGSMEQIMDRSAQAVKLAASGIREPDRAMVLGFSDKTQVEFPFSVMDEESRERLNQTVNRVSAGGGTDFDQALTAALGEIRAGESEHAALFMLTDGNAAIADVPGIAKALSDQGVRLYVFGFKLHSVDNPQLWQIAQETGGSYQTVESADEIEDAFVETYGTVVLGDRLVLQGERAGGGWAARIWRAAVRIIGFLLFGSLMGLAYSFIPNKTDVIFRNGTQGLAAGVLLEAAFYVTGGAGGGLVRLAGVFLLTAAVCGCEEPAGFRSGAKEITQEPGEDTYGWGPKDIL